jgi:hypothetical protein
MAMESGDAPDVRALIEELGVGEVGRRYVARTWDTEFNEDWILFAVSHGWDEESRPLPIDLRWQLALAALEASPDDDVALWLIGDGPFDHLAVEPGMKERIYGERETNARVRRLFDAMRRQLPSEGVTGGWWFQ